MRDCIPFWARVKNGFVGGGPLGLGWWGSIQYFALFQVFFLYDSFQSRLTSTSESTPKSQHQSLR